MTGDKFARVLTGLAVLAVAVIAAIVSFTHIASVAAEAVAAVIASGWARHLGARKASPVSWTSKARKVASPRGGGQ